VTIEGTTPPAPVDDTVRRVVRPLASAKFWIKLVAGVSFVGGVLYALTIIGLVIAWLPIWIGVLLWQAAKRVEEAEATGSEEAATEALGKLGTLFTIYGVLTLIGLILTALWFVAIIVLVMSGEFEGTTGVAHFLGG